MWGSGVEIASLELPMVLPRHSLGPEANKSKAGGHHDSPTHQTAPEGQARWMERSPRYQRRCFRSLSLRDSSERLDDLEAVDPAYRISTGGCMYLSTGPHCESSRKGSSPHLYFGDIKAGFNFSELNRVQNQN